MFGFQGFYKIHIQTFSSLKILECRLTILTVKFILFIFCPVGGVWKLKNTIMANLKWSEWIDLYQSLNHSWSNFSPVRIQIRYFPVSSDGYHDQLFDISNKMHLIYH